MRTRFATALILVMLVASKAAASHINPLVAPTAPWAGHIREMDEALNQKNVPAAERAWHDAYLAAIGVRFWEGMIEVGDASLRIGAGGGFPRAAEATARRSYLTALLRARQLGSVDGALRTAKAFAALGDHEVVERCLKLAEGLAREAHSAKASNRVSAFRAFLAASP